MCTLGESEQNVQLLGGSESYYDMNKIPLNCCIELCVWTFCTAERHSEGKEQWKTNTVLLKYESKFGGLEKKIFHT